MSKPNKMQKSSSSGINYLQLAQERRRLMNEQEENIFQRNIFQDQKKPTKVKLFFDPQEHKFSKEDIPKEKLEQKQTLRDTIQPDILELRKKRWNASTTIPVNKELEEPHDRKLWKIKLGLADGQNVKYKPYKEYQGVETRNIFSGWNSSTYLNQKRGNNFAISKPSQLYNSGVFVSQDRTSQLLPIEYRTPNQRQYDYTRFIRQQKKEEGEIRNQLRDIYTYEYPGCSQEKIDAGVFRLNYETKLKAGKLKQIKEDQNCTFTPDISKTVKRNRVARQYHSGVWMKFQKEKQDGSIKENWAYSCCISEDFNSPGCCTSIRNMDKLNFVSYNNN